MGKTQHSHYTDSNEKSKAKSKAAGEFISNLTNRNKVAIITGRRKGGAKMLWGEKPYYSVDYYLKQTFGSKTYKVALDAGFTCPNRDGTVGYGGCIFCSRGGSGEFAGSRSLSVREQLESGIRNLGAFHAKQYIAYYQAFTNTYADLSYLKQVYEPSFEHPEVAAVSIATRPDCLGEETVGLLCAYAQRKPVWVELGLQTIHERTAAYIRRGYPLSCFEAALMRLKRAGLPVIVHVILGLPGETREDVFETVRYLNRAKIQGIKLQLLHVLEDTDLAADYRAGRFETLSQEAYVAMVADCIGLLSPDIVIHRLTGDGPSEQLIAPQWSRAKRTVLNCIHHELKKRGIYQGCFLEKGQQPR